GFLGPNFNLSSDPLLLVDAAPYLSAGADAADFNNDGHADFIITPFPSDQTLGETFYVNLGDGRGNFVTHHFEGRKDADGYYIPYYGVAAADFDSDGTVDIAAAYYDYLDMYKGNGDGTFEWSARYEYELNLSPLDNYDFNGDGNQDLVAANYGLTGSEVAVFTGNGDGSFADPVIHGGGTSGERNAIAAPPLPPPERNKEPVAVLEPKELEVTVGDEIVFDGSGSYDEDGRIVGYAWDFGDGTVIAADTGLLSLSKAGVDTDEVAPSHTYYDVGKFTVTLSVTDDSGSTASVQAEVNALPVAATIQFRPDTLYLNSKDRWFWATIRLPCAYDARKIDDPSVCIVMEDGSRICASSDYAHGFLAKLKKRFYRRKNALTVRFDQRDLLRKLKISSGSTILMVQGDMLYNGAWIQFQGSEMIKALERKKRRSFFSRYWRQNIKRMHKFCGFKYRR
ncbi:MAG: PKD domain-containing protein, partial [Desulfobacterales bacterium]